MSEHVQRQELHRKIWAIADEVRGAVDGWDFKQYILGILFYRFISENLPVEKISGGNPHRICAKTGRGHQYRDLLKQL